MYEESLKQYVNEDIVYKRYKSGETGFNDYEKFCIKHCKDIESLLEQNRSLKSQLDFIDEQNKYIEKLEKRIDKAIEYINENWSHWCSNHCKYATETIEILKGDSNE